MKLVPTMRYYYPKEDIYVVYVGKAASGKHKFQESGKHTAFELTEQEANTMRKSADAKDTLNKAIGACDVKESLEGQIDIFGNTYTKPKKKEPKNYRVMALVMRMSDGRYTKVDEVYKTYSESQARGYLIKKYSRPGMKIYDVNIWEI